MADTYAEEYEAMMEAAAQHEAMRDDEEAWEAMRDLEAEAEEAEMRMQLDAAGAGAGDEDAAMNALMADQMSKTKRFRGAAPATRRSLEFGSPRAESPGSDRSPKRRGMDADLPGADRSPKKRRGYGNDDTDVGSGELVPRQSPSYKRSRGPAQGAASVPVLDMRSYLHDTPPDGTKTLYCTLPGGQRYCVVKKDINVAQAVDTRVAAPRGDTGILTRSISDMRKLLAEEEKEDAVRRAVRAFEGKTEEPAAPVARGRNRGKGKGKSGKQASTCALWVDKYAPVTFTHLLSRETINRNVMKWVMGWDEVVFGKSRANFGAGKQGAQKKGNSGQGERRFGGGGGGRPGAKDDFAAEVQRRRQRKPWEFDTEAPVLLLCGPPGFGKTTLAHIAAKHAGYNAVEINASDDRTGNAIVQRVVDAMEMKSVFGDQRPNMVILDEIDGASGQGGDRGLQELVRMIVATAKARRERASGVPRAGSGGGGHGGQENDAPGAGPTFTMQRGTRRRGKKKKSGPKVLTRPLICICNNKYAPALHDLRQVAQVVEFKQMSTTRLCSRLSAICQNERLTVRRDVLTKLATLTENDIRSCLNTLQFLKSQYGDNARITHSDLSKFAVGHKDQAPKAFDLWQDVFTAEGSRTLAKDTNLVGIKSRTNAERLLDKLYSFGTTDKLVDGVYENFLSVRYIDPAMVNTSAAMEWLCFADMCMMRRTQRQQYVFGRFVAPSLLGVHTCCRSDFTTKIKFPRMSGRLRHESQQRTAVMAQWLEGRVRCSGLVRYLNGNRRRNGGAGALSVRTGVLDLVSPFLDITSPALRPIKLASLNTEEQALMNSLVDLLVCSRTTFAPFTAAYGEEPEYKMTPNLDMLVDFNDIVDDGTLPAAVLAKRRADLRAETCTRFQLADVVKQVVASKVKVRRMHIEQRALHAATRNEPGDADGDTAMDGSAAPALEHGASPSTVNHHSSQALPDHIANQLRGPSSSPMMPLSQMSKKKGKGKGGSKPSGPRGTFLSRAKSRRTQRGPKPRQMFPVYFKFQEGFTNAVRRAVTIEELL